MSLINEALKKAQNQRTNPPTTPPPGSLPPTAMSSAPEGSPFNRVGVLIGICAVIVSISVLATVFLLRSPSNQPASAPPPPMRIAISDTGTPRANAAPVAVNAPAAAASANTQAAVNTAATANTGVPAATIPGAVAPAATIAVAAAPTVAPTPEPTPVKVTVRIQSLVDKFRVSGIRLSDTGSKVILNDHLFQIDDPVESSLGLRLTKIEAHRLTFVDADGNTYVKRF